MPKRKRRKVKKLDSFADLALAINPEFFDGLRKEMKPLKLNPETLPYARWEEKTEAQKKSRFFWLFRRGR